MYSANYCINFYDNQGDLYFQVSNVQQVDGIMYGVFRIINSNSVNIDYISKISVSKLETEYLQVDVKRVKIIHDLVNKMFSYGEGKLFTQIELYKRCKTKLFAYECDYQHQLYQDGVYGNITEDVIYFDYNYATGRVLIFSSEPIDTMLAKLETNISLEEVR